MTMLDAGRRMKVAEHIAEASAMLKAMRSNTLRAPRMPEYNRHLDMLEDDLMSITARLTDIRPEDGDLKADLLGVVNLVQDLNRVELASVLTIVRAALLEYTGKV